MSNLRIGQGGLSAELVNQARQALQSNQGRITPQALAQLEQTAIRYGGTITDAERHFLANLDNPELVQQLQTSDFNPSNFAFRASSNDRSIALSTGETAQVGLGHPVFQNGSANAAALRNFSQTRNSSGANAACSCNSSVAALVQRGPQATTAAIDALIGAISPPSEAQQADFQSLGRIRQRIQEGTATTQDLNDLSSYLYRKYDSNKSDNQMSYPDVLSMRRDLGLANASTQKQDVIGQNVGSVDLSLAPGTRGQVTGGTVDVSSSTFQQAQRQTADQVLNGIQPGQSAMVGIFNGTGGTDRPNHFVEVGRNAQGQVYVYDPLRQPRHYLTGAEAESHLRSHIGVSLGSSVINGATETYQVQSAATVIARTP